MDLMIVEIVDSMSNVNLMIHISSYVHNIMIDFINAIKLSPINY